jgi:Arabinose efflux permease
MKRGKAIMNYLKTVSKELHTYLILWSTQSFSSFGSSMTSFALIIWSYQQYGSALTTASLSVCSYAPYVLLSIFAGALGDKWNKKTILLICNGFAALCSVAVLILLATGRLAVWHLYLINALNGLMNTVQQPAADVAISLLVPQKHYQKVSGMHSFSNSLITVLAPAAATAILTLTSVQAVISFDLITFAVAFFCLLFFIQIPRAAHENGTKRESVPALAKSGLIYLKHNRGILDLILFLAVINFTASIYDAALPAMMLSRANGGKTALGIVSMAVGIAAMLGSVLTSILPPPKSRVRAICNALLFSMSTENFLLAFGRNVPVWCLGAILGWIFIPFMSANMDVLLRSKIPVEMQGRVYAARNTLQFFTIPIGSLCGGILIDRVFGPFMAAQLSGSPWVSLFGTGKGSGAAMLFMVIGIIGALSCLPFRKDKNIWDLEKQKD